MRNRKMLTRAILAGLVLALSSATAMAWPSSPGGWPFW
jgi:hypothetical protein